VDTTHGELCWCVCVCVCVYVCEGERVSVHVVP
jgi:hypothetical protein